MKLRLLIADQIEGLVSGKMMALGIFPDNVIILKPEMAPGGGVEQPPYQVNIAVLCTLTELPPVTAAGVIEILAPQPGAERVAHMDMGVVTGHPGRSLSAPGRLNPFVVPRAGFYTVRARVGEDEASAEFEVRVQLPPEAEASPEAVEAPLPAPPAPARRKKKPAA